MPSGASSRRSPEPAMERRYLRWWSPNLGRDMELLAFGHAGTRVLVFPTRCGRFFDFENFGMLEAVRPRIEAGELQLWCVDSIDTESFYAQWMNPADRIRRHQKYEDYLLGEVLPLMHVDEPGVRSMTCGCSLGAYHAVNLALRHPRLFVKAVGLSGRYDLTERLPEFRDLLDGFVDDLVYFHMPTMFLGNAREPEHLEGLRHLEVVLACGESDPFLISNRKLAEQLEAKGMRHQLYVWQGRAHGRRHWRQMSDLYLH